MLRDGVPEDAMLRQRLRFVLVMAVGPCTALMGVAASSSDAASRPVRPYDVNGDGYADLVVGCLER
jgi:hypothetical protein